MTRKIVLIAHNLRSCHNVGSLLRTAEGLAINKVYLTGYTPFPEMPNDPRLPHLWRRISSKINKTALGAENSIAWEHASDVKKVIKELMKANYQVAALEQTPSALALATYQPPTRVALIVGREIDGIEQSVLDLVDISLEIPMLGQKESFNVAEAATMALYHCRFAK